MGSGKELRAVLAPAPRDALHVPVRGSQGRPLTDARPLAGRGIRNPAPARSLDAAVHIVVAAALHMSVTGGRDPDHAQHKTQRRPGCNCRAHTTAAALIDDQFAYFATFCFHRPRMHTAVTVTNQTSLVSRPGRLVTHSVSPGQGFVRVGGLYVLRGDAGVDPEEADEVDRIGCLTGFAQDAVGPHLPWQ